MTQQINLYNPAFLRRNQALEPAALLAYALLAVLVLMLLGNVLVRQQRSQNEAMAGALDAQIKAEQEKVAAFAAQRSAQKKDPVLEAEQSRLDALVRGRRASLTAIQTGAVGSTTGFSEHMRALARQSVSGLWLTGFSIGGGGSEVSLRGRMLEAGLLPRFLGKLGAEKAFEGRGFKTLLIDLPKLADGEVAPALPVTQIAAAPLQVAAPPGTPALARIQGAAPAYLSFEIATGDVAGRATDATQGARK